MKDRLIRLCQHLQLGKITHGPQILTGGLLNQMSLIETETGKYVVKTLNPKIMERPTAKTNYLNSEIIAEKASMHIPALPARKFNGTFLHELDNHHYLVFDWIPGRCLRPSEVTALHCEKMGVILAKIHDIQFPELEKVEPTISETNWNLYYQKGQEAVAPWLEPLSAILMDLFTWQKRANTSLQTLAKYTVFSHRDLDPKNVLWHRDCPMVIDWEAAGPVNPLQELLETALYWAKEDADINKARFLTFISAYQKHSSPLHADWKIVLDSGFAGKLGWLDYNLKRSLWMECNDAEEQKLGTSQVFSTIESLKEYANTISELEEWLKAL